MKRRLGGRSTGIFYLERPFFDVSVELRAPAIVLSPDLGGIQAAINAAAKRILSTSKRLRCWAPTAGVCADHLHLSPAHVVLLAFP